MYMVSVLNKKQQASRIRECHNQDKNHQMAPGGRNLKHRQPNDSQNTIKVKQPAIKNQPSIPIKYFFPAKSMPWIMLLKHKNNDAFELIQCAH